MSPAAPGRRDPLLAFVRLVLGTTMAFMAAVSAILFLTVPAVFVLQDSVVGTLVERGAPREAIWAIALVIALAAIIGLLAVLFLRHLYRIVGSVGDGDPFVPANADRLRAMAWISIAAHLAAIPIAALGHWAETLSRNIRFELSYPLSGIFMALVLFVLARVFREGARMREELDGTV